MLAFVTGATGFLGSHVARVLAEQGADLRLLVRPTSDLRNISDLNADRVVGDLRDAPSIEKALSGCDVVFHVAADYRLWVRDPDEMYRSNVEGTRSLLGAARGVHVECGDDGLHFGFRFRRECSRRTERSRHRRHDRALQSFEVHGGGSRRWGREIWSRRGDCESYDADRRARYQADSDRADRPGFPEAKISGVRGDGLEPGGCD